MMMRMVLSESGELIPAGDSLPAVPSNDQIRQLEVEMLKHEQVILDTTMIAHGRMCARTILIPAGVALTGALINHDNICIVSGDISVTSSEGVKRLTGFHVLPSAAGFKRAGIAHADTWWTCIWHTDLTDPTDIENDMTDEAESLQTRRAITHQEN